eukprot:491594-Rhodomonas_salina.1
MFGNHNAFEIGESGEDAERGVCKGERAWCSCANSAAKMLQASSSMPCRGTTPAAPRTTSALLITLQ